MYSFSDLAKDEYGCVGTGQEANTEDDHGYCDCVHHLLVTV